MLKSYNIGDMNYDYNKRCLTRSKTGSFRVNRRRKRKIYKTIR